MANYSIRDLEHLSGVKAHTIRIWEKRYSLLLPKRTETNIRYYDDTDLKKILNIALLNRHGIKISRIAQFKENEIYEQIHELTRNNPDLISRIDNLVISMVEMDESKFRKTLSAKIHHHGFDNTLLGLIYPFLEKVGILWQTGSIHPAQEHFVTNLIRQKLCAAIESIRVKENPGSKRFLIFLPEGELHEIGLLFYDYLAKKHGHSVIYLGQSVPSEDLESVQKIKLSDYLLTSFSSTINEMDENEYISRLAEKFSDSKILFSSFDSAGMKRLLPENVMRILNPAHFIEFLKSIS